MRLLTDESEHRDTRQYTLEIEGVEVRGAQLDDGDRRLLEEWARSRSIADKLFALGLLARRIESERERA